MCSARRDKIILRWWKSPTHTGQVHQAFALSTLSEQRKQAVGRLIARQVVFE